MMSKSYDSYFVRCRVVQRPWNYLDSLSTEWELMMSALPANLQGCHEIVGFCELQSITFVSW